jgi:hypothetical protein
MPPGKQGNGKWVFLESDQHGQHSERPPLKTGTRRRAAGPKSAQGLANAEGGYGMRRSGGPHRLPFKLKLGRKSAHMNW